MLKCPETWDEIIGMIFERQRFIIDSTKKLEQLPDPPIALHTAHGQRVMRDFAWRVTEELAESHEAFIKYEETEVAKCQGLEELADAVHYLVELLIYAGIPVAACLNKTPKFWTHKGLSITGAYWDLVYKMGLAMNNLQNRPWRKNRDRTDEAKFRSAILEAWVSLIKCWAVLGCTQEDLFNSYMKKSAIVEARWTENVV